MKTKKLESNLKVGIVDWFDNSSGEGFIQDAETGRWRYIHYSAISSKNKFKELKQGSKVHYRHNKCPVKVQVTFCKVIDDTKFYKLSKYSMGFKK